MIKNSANIFLIDNSDIDQYGHMNISHLDIDLGDGPIEKSICYDDVQVELTELMPVARQLCDMSVETAIQSQENQGQPISCEKGCSHCCEYLVPISSTEAFQLSNDIMQLPRPRRQQALRKSLMAARKLLSRKMPEHICHEDDEAQRLKDISEWYMSLNLSCPFLENKQCSIYEKRPLACREYMATSDHRFCQLCSGIEPTNVELAVKISEVMTMTSNRLEMMTGEAIMLPLSIVFCDSNSDRGQITRKASTVVRCFVESLQDAHAIQANKMETLIA